MTYSALSEYAKIRGIIRILLEFFTIFERKYTLDFERKSPCSRIILEYTFSKHCPKSKNYSRIVRIG
jgi:hypothetical protein